MSLSQFPLQGSEIYVLMDTRLSVCNHNTDMGLDSTGRLNKMDFKDQLVKICADKSFLQREATVDLKRTDSLTKHPHVVTLISNCA